MLERQYRYLTEAEFQQEAIEYTAEQLKEYGLYEKHINHFAKLRSRAMSHRALQLFAKVSISLLVLAIPIIVGFYLEERSLASRSDISMLPDLAHKDVPRLEEKRSSIFNRLLWRTGLLKSDNNVTWVFSAPLTSHPPQNDSQSPTLSPATTQEELQREVEVEEGDPTVSHITVYEDTTLPSMQGMNIFSFAYSVAVDFLSRTFSWGDSTKE